MKQRNTRVPPDRDEHIKNMILINVDFNGKYQVSNNSTSQCSFAFTYAKATYMEPTPLLFFFSLPSLERCRHQGYEEEILEGKRLNIKEFKKNAHNSNFLHHHQPTHRCNYLQPKNHLHLDLQRKSSASQK